MVSSVGLAKEDGHTHRPFDGQVPLAKAHRFLYPANVFYTYILESLNTPGLRYTGHTADLKQRVSDHNAGKCIRTRRNAPWAVRFYAAFETEPQAQHFERYLKSGSGHEFAKRHIWQAEENDHPVNSRT